MWPRHSRFGDLPGSISQFLILNTPLQPHRKAFPGSKSVILILSPLSAALPGSDLAFPSPNAPSAPRSEALSGANPAFLSPRALPDGLPGSISAVLSQMTLSNCSATPPGIKTQFFNPAGPFRLRLLGLQVRSRRGIYRGSAPNPGAPQALSNFAAQSHGPGRSADADC